MHPALKRVIDLDTAQKNEIDRLRAVNAELVAALRGVIAFEWASSDTCQPGSQTRNIGQLAADRARAALAAADNVPSPNGSESVES